MHVARGYDADQGTSSPQRERYMQATLFIGLAQRMEPRLNFAVSMIMKQQQRVVEKNLLGLDLADAVFIHALARVAIIPIKTGNEGEINHRCILL